MKSKSETNSISLADTRHLTTHTSERILLFFWLLIIASLLLGFDIITHLNEPIGDEGVHSYQIYKYLNGSYEHFKHVTMLPVYHAANAIIVKLLGNTEFSYLRFANILLSAIAIPAFLALAKSFYPNQAYSRTLQFLFIPFLFPLYFLIYTDLFSLAFTLLMIERTLKKKYYMASAFAFCAVFTRQPNLIWVAYCCLIIYFGKNNPLFSKSHVISFLNDAWPLLSVMLLFVAFALWNGGFTVGDKEQHQVSLNISNYYFFLLVSFALFLPYNIAHIGIVKNLLMEKKWLLIVLFVMLFVYLSTYEHPHKYNTKELSFYRHNLLLHYSCDIYWLRILSYFAMAWMALSYYASARSSKDRVAQLLLLPMSFLSMVPLPLIEQRYYLVSLSLFIAMQSPVSEKVTAFTLVYYISATSYILYHISRANFFL